MSDDESPHGVGTGSGEQPGARDDRQAVVARLREELAAARERVRDAWQRYQDEGGDDAMLPAVAGPPVLLQVLSQGL